MFNFENTYIIPKISNYTSRSQVNLVETFEDLNLNCVPIIVSNMDTVGTLAMAKALEKHNMLVCIDCRWNTNDFDNIDELSNVIRTYGFNTDNETIINNSPKNSIICLDTPNGYMKAFVEKVKLIAKECPDLTIIAGNVISPDGCKKLIDAGAKIIKLGIGNGQQCETTKITGIGLPILQTVLDCYSLIQKNNCYSIADGGCKNPGDFAKLFVAGADFVMAGTYFAGHTECKTHDRIYGMSSKDANEKYNEDKSLYYAYEGKTTKVEFKGSVDNTISQLLGGLRSTCTYTGAENCRDLFYVTDLYS